MRDAAKRHAGEIGTVRPIGENEIRMILQVLPDAGQMMRGCDPVPGKRGAVADPGQQVEFVIAMGNWMMFSLLFRNLRIPLAEGLMVWPPDGLASPAAEG